MEERLKSARLKVEWADKHILQIHDMFREFSQSDFYSMRVEEDSEEKTHSLRIDIDLGALNFESCALIIGDVLHNLRSALDHLYYQVVLACDGTPTRWTHFPISESSQKLAGWINGAVGQKQISTPIAKLLSNSIKPHKGGNHALWRLRQLNNLDKHEIIVPVLELVGFLDVRLEDERGEQVGLSNYMAEKSCVVAITGTYRRKVVLKDKGRAFANVIFNRGAPEVAGEIVFPTLKHIAEEVTRTIEAFASLKME